MVTAVVVAAFLLTLAAAVEGGQEAGTHARKDGAYPPVPMAAPPAGTRVGLVVGNPGKETPTVRAYLEVLDEEGFCGEALERTNLTAWSPAALARRYGALVLPEGENRDLTPAQVEALRRYVVAEGGQLLVVYDAGLTQPLMSQLTGVRVRDLPYEGHWSFGTPEGARRWGFPPGKYDSGGLLTGYVYGPLWYRHLAATAAGATVLARDPSRPDPDNVVVAERRFASGGTVVYVNAPLARYKRRTDDLPARAILQTFLTCYARLPHLLATPEGKGTLVVNIHVCSGALARPLARMLSDGILDRRIPFSVHVTAGPDCRRPGDGAGFDIARPDRAALVRAVSSVAAVGSHGGWVHDYFAYQLQQRPTADMEDCLTRNFAALTAATGRPVREYSAPRGNQPAWVTRWLAEHGVAAFYTTADTGSGPVRPWLDDGPLEGAIWEFPITPLGRYACLEEMRWHLVPAAEVVDWIDDLTTFCAQRRVARTIYTHAADDPYSRLVLQHLRERLLRLSQQGRLRVAPMGEVADFLNRRARTAWEVARTAEGYSVTLANPLGLQGFALAVYAGGGRVPPALPPGWRAERQGGWWYLICEGTGTRASFNLSLGS